MKPSPAFEEMNWHDNHVRGFSIREGKSGAGELVLDIDYITQWNCEPDHSYSFLIQPATLTFHEASDLVITLNYASMTLALVPPAIHSISREPYQYPNGYREFAWRIEFNVPNGEITFKASSFSQQARGEAAKSDSQFLPAEVRPGP
nr:putative integron gene cassette protein [uncultured bacterium]